MKKVLKNITAITIALVITAGSVLSMSTQSMAKARISKSSISIIVGKTYKLSVKGVKKKAKWSTSNKKIASVTKTGVVKGKKVGNAKIKAKVGKKTYTCKVKVTTKAATSAKTTSAAVTKTTATPVPTQAANSTATVKPTQTPTPTPVGLSIADEEKALKEIITTQNKNGAKMPTDVNNTFYMRSIDGHLKGLIISTMGLSGSLDLSKFAMLDAVYCDDNKLTSINVSANTELTILSCGGNQLTTLNVAANTKLTSLVCSSNNLTELSVNNNVALTKLNCDHNELKALDVSNNINLKSLKCNKNSIATLDLTKNKKLTDYLGDDSVIVTK